MTKRVGLADHLRYLHTIGVAILPFVDLKIVYMKVPKTGGTSIINTLRTKGYKRPSVQSRKIWLDSKSYFGVVYLEAR